MEQNDKNEQVDRVELAKKIKAMETKKRQDALKSVPTAAEQKMHYDGWFALRGPSIPKQHAKEILRADFKARGLTDKETVARFDAALAVYGVTLK